MSILIKNIEMPKSCEECRFFTWSHGIGQHCDVDDGITFHATINGFDVGYERNGDCPLVPVPPSVYVRPVKRGKWMYDELIKRLKDAAHWADEGWVIMPSVCLEAADAIEELSKYANTTMQLKCEGWYLQRTKYRDGYTAIETMPLPEPPKEEKE